MDVNQKFVGKVLDRRYKINKVIGVGGMSIVFEAFDVVSERVVAVKVLKEEMAADEQATRRFVNESRAVSMLSHPNIVKIYDVSVKSYLKYIVMERIDGITLKSYIQRRGKLSTVEILSYTEQILAALAHAHSKGIVHRDIKPQNILLLRSGKIKVSDFGIATMETEEERNERKAVGTVYYISPEQAAGRKTDGRTDIYSVGVMMYEMATGELPFVAETPVEIARKHITEMPRRPREINPEIPLGLEQVILGAMEKKPEMRFASAEQMGAFISRLRANPDRVFRTVRKDTGTIVPAQTGDEQDMAKKKKKQKKKQSSSMFPIICGVTVAFLAVFLVTGLYMFDRVLKSESENTPITVEVPDVTGSLYDDKVRAMFDETIYKVDIEYRYDASYPKDTIIKQEPSGGAKRKVLKNRQFCAVTLTVSHGSRMVNVPDLTLMDYRTAQIKAEKIGLTVKLQAVDSDTVEIGYVVRSEPAARTSTEVGSTITLYYSRGSVADNVKVPQMTGMSPTQAYSKMGGNFRVGQVTYAYSPTVPSGNIISQSVPSGSSVPKGTKISFVISLGPEPSGE